MDDFERFIANYNRDIKRREKDKPEQYTLEHKKLTEDVKKYGVDNFHGEYRNISFTMKRNNTYAWVGYIILPRTITRKEYDEIDSLMHGGITYYKEKTIGFDCSHEYDYSTYNFDYTNYSPMNGCKYRNYDYVIKIIKNVIDFLLNDICLKNICINSIENKGNLPPLLFVRKTQDAKIKYRTPSKIFDSSSFN